jgi:hypothetical protein
LKFTPPSGISKSKWVQGLSTLSGLWKRGLLPHDLERQFFLQWFVVYKGNIAHTAKAIGLHRSTIQGYFLKFGYAKKAVKLRHTWQRMELDKKESFEKRFYSFYKEFGGKPSFTPEEIAGLVGLWQTKFPFKTLYPHYILWAVRSGKPRDWVEKKLDYSYRHRARLLNPLLNPKTRDGFWLSPLKPQVKEIYLSRYQTIFARGKKGSS